MPWQVLLVGGASAARNTILVTAAFEEFSERGYHATSIADIARRLEMGHGTFYRYFENKRDIVDHVVEELVGRVLAALYSLLDEDPRVMRTLLLQAAAVDRALSERVMNVFADAAEVVTGYLENGRDRGFLRADLDAEATGRALVVLVLAGILDALRAPHDGVGRERSRRPRSRSCSTAWPSRRRLERAASAGALAATDDSRHESGPGDPGHAATLLTARGCQRGLGR